MKRFHCSDQRVTLKKTARVRSNLILYFLKSLALPLFSLQVITICDNLPHAMPTIFPLFLIEFLVLCPSPVNSGTNIVLNKEK